ncbi:polysaccharide deacetylase family protein [Paenibacillus thermotolerans]|uniref:polysaccharide deacetylase family protein n=1 Tax=Paenibacillus thermotolerans TaxID=3027807 RepID=UPI002367E6DA|nr:MULTISPECIES: polysaccharide deacetylase family protein [unclassified Paenibacillus]
MKVYISWKSGFFLLALTVMALICLIMMPQMTSAAETSASMRQEAETSNRPTVYLTFDDGPSKLTPKVLDILKEHDVKATFFVLGELASAREETIRRIAAEGHALGNHTYDHKYQHLYKSFDGFLRQVQATDEVLKRITGNSVRLLRAPGGTSGNFDELYFHYLREAGFSIHDWNVDSGDSKRRGVPAKEIVGNVKRSKLGGDLVVLLHDGAGHEETVKALPEIIAFFQAKGYRFEALSEQVKPVTFRVGKLKWDRSKAELQDAELLAAVQQLKRDSTAPATVSGRWVALRDWADGKGAVTWDNTKKTAGLVLSGGVLQFNVSAKTSVWTGAGSMTEAKLSFKLENNKVYVLETEAEALYAMVRATESV